MAYFQRVLILMMVIWTAQGLTKERQEICTNSTKIHSDLLKGLNFGGVLTVLAMDFMVFLCMLLMFSCMQRLGDHGRLALVKNVNAVRENEAEEDEAKENERPPFCSWLTSMYCISDEQIREKCGEDAEHYLSFQRHIIQLLVVMCVMSIFIILPINFSGHLYARNNPYNFGRTMIANLDSDNPRLWLHTVFALFYVILTLYFMKRHNSKMHYKEDDVVRHTLFITGIPKGSREEDIQNHFDQAYKEDGCVVVNISLCFDVSKLIALKSKRAAAQRTKIFYTELENKRLKEGKEGSPAMINPKSWLHGPLFIFNKCGKKEEAVRYYTDLEKQLDADFKTEREAAAAKPLGMAFVTFRSEAMTNIIMRDFNACKCYGKYCRCWCQKPKESSINKEKLKVNLRNPNIGVTYATDPSNINWGDLSCNKYFWWFRWFVINISLFVLLYYLTTPARFITKMDDLKVIDELNPILKMFLPTVLMAVLTCTLPIVFLYSSDLEAHWTQSVTRKVAMFKGYSFLILMVLVLPSLGLSNLEVFFNMLFSINKDAELDRFDCVFLPHIGAFFVNYVIASAFIGIPCELLNIPGFVKYTIHICLARSEADRRFVKADQAEEFDYGTAYAWMMCVFTIVMAYSIACPIIVPFGLMYMLMKRFADRYNMYYAYLPAKLDKNIHSAAVTYVGMAPIICLFYVFFFTFTKGFQSPPFIFTTVVLSAILVVAIMHIFFGHFKCLHNLSINWENSKELDADCDKDMYIPEILKGRDESEDEPEEHDDLDLEVSSS